MVADIENHIGPQWLTQSYIEKILHIYKKDKMLRIVTLQIKPAIPKGENYASVMTRVNLTYENEKGSKSKISFIVKTSHEDDPKIAEIYKPYQVFETEMAMYETVLPKLSEMLQKIGDKDKLFADTIYVDYENEAIIFEDLSVQDFGLADRIAGMDLDSAKLALKKLAKMHASAAVLNEQTQGSLEKFTRGIFNRHTRGFGCAFENILGVCAEFAGNCPELGQYYKDKLLKLKAHLVEYVTRTFDLHEGFFHTLNHGDYWINNVMVRCGKQNTVNGCPKKQIKDLLIIDFQFCTWTSPALDLHYFFNTSLENKLRFNNQDELVQYYYGILRDTLLKLNYKGYIPTLHDFWLQMEAAHLYAVSSSLASQAVMINENNEDADVQALFLDDERAKKFRRMLYTNKTVQENAKKLLPYFDKRGLLDVID